MSDHLPTLINIITGEPIDKSDKVKDKIQDDMSPGSSEADLLKVSVVTPHDKEKSHLSPPYKYALIKSPRNRTTQRLKK